MKFETYLMKKEDFAEMQPILQRLGDDLEKFAELTVNDFLSIKDIICVEEKRYAFSKQIKYIYFKHICDGTTRNVGVDIAFDFARNGELEIMSISDKSIIDSITDSNLYDSVNIQYLTNQANFYRNGNPYIYVNFKTENGEIVITGYQYNQNNL